MPSLGPLTFTAGRWFPLVPEGHDFQSPSHVWPHCILHLFLMFLQIFMLGIRENTWPQWYDETPVSLSVLWALDVGTSLSTYQDSSVAVFLEYHLTAVSHWVWEEEGVSSMSSPWGLSRAYLVTSLHPASLIQGCCTPGTKGKAVFWTSAQGFGFIQNFPHQCHDWKISFLDENKAVQLSPFIWIAGTLIALPDFWKSSIWVFSELSVLCLPSIANFFFCFVLVLACICLPLGSVHGSYRHVVERRETCLCCTTAASLMHDSIYHSESPLSPYLWAGSLSVIVSGETLLATLVSAQFINKQILIECHFV